jgi:hypothetical protein
MRDAATTKTPNPVENTAVLISRQHTQRAFSMHDNGKRVSQFFDQGQRAEMFQPFLISGGQLTGPARVGLVPGSGLRAPSSIAFKAPWKTAPSFT